MRTVGPILVIIFSILILGSTFLPYADGFGGDETFWELTSGADIALAVACVLALACALGALLITGGPLRALAGLFAGLTCGVIWAFSANVVTDSEGTKAGFWVLTVLGILILISAVILILSPPAPAAAAPSPGRAAGPAPAAFAGPAAPPPAVPPTPAAPAAASHPAGWHPDPSGGPGERYWDGTHWTDQFRPAR